MVGCWFVCLVGDADRCKSSTKSSLLRRCVSVGWLPAPKPACKHGLMANALMLYREETNQRPCGNSTRVALCLLLLLSLCCCRRRRRRCCCCCYCCCCCCCRSAAVPTSSTRTTALCWTPQLTTPRTCAYVHACVRLTICLCCCFGRLFMRALLVRNATTGQRRKQLWTAHGSKL